MKKEYLTGFGLTDEEAKQILDKVNDELAAVKQTLETANSDLREQLNAANETIKSYDGVNAADYKNKIADYETKLETLKTESAEKLKNIVLDNAIGSKLSAVPEKYRKLIEGQIDRNKLTVGEDNSVAGLDEQYLKLKEEYADLFVNKGRLSFGFDGFDGFDVVGGRADTGGQNILENCFGIKAD